MTGGNGTITLLMAHFVAMLRLGGFPHIISGSFAF